MYCPWLILRKRRVELIRFVIVKNISSSKSHVFPPRYNTHEGSHEFTCFCLCVTYFCTYVCIRQLCISLEPMVRMCIMSAFMHRSCNLGDRGHVCHPSNHPRVPHLGDGATLDEGGLVRRLGGWNERRRRGNVGR